MSHKKRKYSPYKTSLCYHALDCVFNTLDFSQAGEFEVTADGLHSDFKGKNMFPSRIKPKILTMQNILYQSYCCNLGILREYARDHNIDEVAYILSIRDELLKVPGVREYDFR